MERPSSASRRRRSTSTEAAPPRRRRDRVRLADSRASHKSREKGSKFTRTTGEEERRGHSRRVAEAVPWVPVGDEPRPRRSQSLGKTSSAGTGPAYRPRTPVRDGRRARQTASSAASRVLLSVLREIAKKGKSPKTLTYPEKGVDWPTERGTAEGELGCGRLVLEKRVFQGLGPCAVLLEFGTTGGRWDESLKLCTGEGRSS